jgi:4-hydroxy-tetrahydrodipicolinate reductase
MPYKVIQWATGNVGALQLAQTIDNPDLELVGVYVYTPEKAGRDAGELIGREPVGVLATNNLDEILALEADVVLHAPLSADVEQLDKDVVALLRSGKNVISTAGYYQPRLRGPEFLAELEEACRAGNATLHGSGIEPGFVFDRIATTLTGMCSELDHIHMIESSDASGMTYEFVLREMIGMGKQPEAVTIDGPFGQYFQIFFGEVMTLVADSLSVDLDEIEAGLDLALASRDLDIAVGRIPAGTIAGTNYWLRGVVDGKEFLRLDALWFVEKGIDGYMAPEHNCMWQIVLTGKPSARLTLDVLPTYDNEGNPEFEPTWMATASVAVNVIQAVCAAAPGVFHAPVFGAWSPRKTAIVSGQAS